VGLFIEGVDVWVINEFDVEGLLIVDVIVCAVFDFDTTDLLFEEVVVWTTDVDGGAKISLGSIVPLLIFEIDDFNGDFSVIILFLLGFTFDITLLGTIFGKEDCTFAGILTLVWFIIDGFTIDEDELCANAGGLGNIIFNLGEFIWRIIVWFWSVLFNVRFGVNIVVGIDEFV